jgi:tyrosine-protein phosphatase SIW14
MRVSPAARWCMGISIGLFIAIVPYVYYRMTYRTNKRLRVVVANKVYRSGAMTAVGFRNAVERLGIRTVLNLQEESPDPEMDSSYFSLSTIKESELCKELGINLVFMHVEIVPPAEFPATQPPTIERFRAIMDDPSNYPVLIHCRAGLHRTGCLVALYRMEYEGWTRDEALRELKSHGFGEFVSSSANDYIMQYIVSYQPRPRAADGTLPAPTAPGVPVLPVSRATDDFRLRLPQGN